jgi:hypothetical protein
MLSNRLIQRSLIQNVSAYQACSSKLHAKKCFNNPDRQLSMPAMKGQLQRKMWSDKVSQGDHSKDGKGAKTESGLKLSADKRDVLSSVVKVSLFYLMYQWK